MKNSTGVDSALHRPTCGAGGNGGAAEAGDVSGTIFVDQDICLRHEVVVNYATSVRNGGKAYGLELSVSNVQAVDVLQTSGDLCKLLSKSIRGLTEMRERGAYQLQPPYVGPIPQALPEVKVFRVLVNDSEWVRLSRVHSHERNHVYAPLAEEVACVYFVPKPLRGNSQCCVGHKQWLQRTAAT